MDAHNHHFEKLNKRRVLDLKFYEISNFRDMLFDVTFWRPRRQVRQKVTKL